jgi:hypothetical protein
MPPVNLTTHRPTARCLIEDIGPLVFMRVLGERLYFFAGLYPAFSASASVMNFPCLVLP